MKIIIKSKNIRLLPAFKGRIEKKVKSLGKFIQKIEGFEEQAYVEVEKTTFHHRKGYVFRAEYQISLPGRTLRVEDSAEDLRTAIDGAGDQMQVQLKKYKGKIASKRKRGYRKIKRETSFSTQARLKAGKSQRIREESLWFFKAKLYFLKQPSAAVF